jgi:hypothetical protein
MGTAVLLTYVALGRRRIDYRWILVGAVLPDVVDALLVGLAGLGAAGRGAAHSVMAPSLVAVVVVAALRGPRRLAVFGLAVGWLAHLVADGMWQAPETFLWPAFGWSFSTAPAEPYSSDLVLNPWDHLGTFAGELAGAAILAWFWVAFRLGHDGRARLFLKDGYLRP